MEPHFGLVERADGRLFHELSEFRNVAVSRKFGCANGPPTGFGGPKAFVFAEFFEFISNLQSGWIFCQSVRHPQVIFGIEPQTVRQDLRFLCRVASKSLDDEVECFGRVGILMRQFPTFAFRERAIDFLPLAGAVGSKLVEKLSCRFVVASVALALAFSPGTTVHSRIVDAAKFTGVGALIFIGLEQAKRSAFYEAIVTSSGRFGVNVADDFLAGLSNHQIFPFVSSIK